MASFVALVHGLAGHLQLHLPFEITPESVHLTDSDEQWTKVLKQLMADLKFLLAYTEHEITSDKR